jgi:hypothetical protein
LNLVADRHGLLVEHRGRLIILLQIAPVFPHYLLVYVLLEVIIQALPVLRHCLVDDRFRFLL